jgi:hypothetical protein
VREGVRWDSSRTACTARLSCTERNEDCSHLR